MIWQGLYAIAHTCLAPLSDGHHSTSQVSARVWLFVKYPDAKHSRETPNVVSN